LSHPTSASPSPAAALAALRERYRAAAPRTIALLREHAEVLERAPEAAEPLAALRRELHRVRGTAGSYGFTEASVLCGAMEERAVRWSEDAAADAGARGALLRRFAEALAVAFTVPAADAEPLPLTAFPAPRGAAEGTAAADEPDEPDEADEADDVGAGADEVPDVVVVEDDDALADMIAFGLDAAGVSHRRHATGPEALGALLALPQTARRPVVLLDVDLPGMDGHTLHERLSAERPGAFGVVFMTSHAGEGEQLRAFHVGALDYLVKPVNLRVLLAKVAVWRRAAGAR
jgi:CheY-like chemotaxis protein/HPt (histidine-containing phosphotransfer) domain-containing protein